MTALFPLSPTAMDAGWLAEALGAPAGTLAGFDAVPIGTGQMADSFRLTLSWSGDSSETLRPATIVAKCPSHDPESRRIGAALGSYWREAMWYRDLAGQSRIACPPCHFAGMGDDPAEFLLLLGDLAPAQQGDQLAGAERAALEAAADQAALLHAAFWESPILERVSWLKSDTNTEMVRVLLPQLFEGFRTRYAKRLSAETLALAGDLVARIDAYLAYTPHARSLVHGDFRVDNMLFAPEGGVHIVDWQTLGIGSPFADLAYLVGTSVADPAVRAALDAPLFERYCAALEREGVAVDHEAGWREYRLYALSGVIMAIFASMNVERTERGDEMFAVMAERPARQAADLDSLALL